MKPLLPSISYKGYKNRSWLKTDDDSGNADVWVNALFISCSRS